jgi:hypothetical protein
MLERVSEPPNYFSLVHGEKCGRMVPRRQPKERLIQVKIDIIDLFFRKQKLPFACAATGGL